MSPAASEQTIRDAIPFVDGWREAYDALDALIAERDRARHLAKRLSLMIDRQAWRDSGSDDGQGHYEGDYHAARIEEEIRSWEN